MIIIATEALDGLQLNLADTVQEGEDGRVERIRIQREVAAAPKVRVLRLLQRADFLLDLSLRVHDLFGLHGRKFLGNDL
ncbi:MAG TPA: hypothetical protein VEF34_08400 [Syntrophobacteraceae bacterium]|nr:hypothetical protein [Syntrophobacteraceae bacterium]